MYDFNPLSAQGWGGGIAKTVRGLIVWTVVMNSIQLNTNVTALQ